VEGRLNTTPDLIFSPYRPIPHISDLSDTLCEAYTWIRWSMKVSLSSTEYFKRSEMARLRSVGVKIPRSETFRKRIRSLIDF
jgi:hypothetical protein